MNRLLIPVALAVCLMSFAGCSDQSSASHNVSGTISFKGETVPVGYIQFIPAVKGPQGFAKIKDGKFNTNVAGEARGIEEGEYEIKISGYDGVAYKDPDDDNEINGNGHALFPQYRMKKKFGAENSELEIDVSAKQ